jgi:hypothetical protein
MGQSNISWNLKDRIARVMGERQQVVREIERIETLVQELPDTMVDVGQRVRTLLGSWR